MRRCTVGTMCAVLAVVLGVGCRQAPTARSDSESLPRRGSAARAAEPHPERAPVRYRGLVVYRGQYPSELRVLDLDTLRDRAIAMPRHVGNHGVNGTGTLDVVETDEGGAQRDGRWVSRPRVYIVELPTGRVSGGPFDGHHGVWIDARRLTYLDERGREILWDAVAGTRKPTGARYRTATEVARYLVKRNAAGIAALERAITGPNVRRELPGALVLDCGMDRALIRTKDVELTPPLEAIVSLFDNPRGLAACVAPGTRRVAVNVRPQGDGPSALYVAAPYGAVRTLRGDAMGNFGWRMAWLPDGEALLVERWRGEPPPGVPHVYSTPPRNYASIHMLDLRDGRTRFLAWGEAPQYAPAR